MQLDDQQILSLSRELWASHFGLSIHTENGEAGDSEEKTWSSCVKISGPWQGAVMLECPESIVKHAAAMLFASDEEDDIEDAAKELAEMFGKKMHPLLPETTKLSRPSIVVDREQSKVLAGMQDLKDFKFSCEGRPVRVVLFEGEPDLAAAG